MDLAYHKYKEIVRNLDEGLKVSITPPAIFSSDLMHHYLPVLQ